MEKLAARDEIGRKFVLKIELWDSQNKLLKKIETLLENDKKISFDQFHSSFSGQLNTFIVYAEEEKYLTPYREMPVRGNMYDKKS